MRIISGKYFKKFIPVAGRSRPPLKLIRQYIFDFIENNFGFTKKVVLDLCSGSGSFGLEALSRDAEFAYFFEEDYNIAQNLRKTINDFGAENARIIVKNVKYLPMHHSEDKTNEEIAKTGLNCKEEIAKTGASYKKADLIFFDPPFGHQYAQEVIDKIIKKSWSSKDAMLIFRNGHEFENQNKHYELISYKRIGCSFIYIYKIIC